MRCDRHHTVTNNKAWLTPLRTRILCMLSSWWENSNQSCTVFCTIFNFKKGTSLGPYLTLLLALLLAIFSENVMKVILKHAYIHVLFLFTHSPNHQSLTVRATSYKYASQGTASYCVDRLFRVELSSQYTPFFDVWNFEICVALVAFFKSFQIRKRKQDSIHRIHEVSSFDSEYLYDYVLEGKSETTVSYIISWRSESLSFKLIVLLHVIL